MKIYDNTQLTEMGLTHDLIMQGETIEVDPEVKLNKKEKYVRHDFISKVLEAYGADLHEAYTDIVSLEERITELETQLKETTDNANKSTNDLRRVLSSEQEFSEAEKILAHLESQMSLCEKQIADYKESKTTDAQTIESLTNELDTLRAEIANDGSKYEGLREEVDNFFDMLKGWFEEEGIGDLYMDDEFE